MATQPSRYRKVSQSMWADIKFRRLSRAQPNGQSLFQWLLTGPYTTNIPGVVIGKPTVFAADLEWPIDDFREAFYEVIREGLAEADPGAGLVWLPNAPRHNKPRSAHVVTNWRETWPLIPECPLKHKILQALKVFTKEWGEGFADAFDAVISKSSPIQEQEQEQEQEKETALRADLFGITHSLSPPSKKPSEHQRFVAGFTTLWRGFTKRDDGPTWGKTGGGIAKDVLELAHGSSDEALRRAEIMFRTWRGAGAPTLKLLKGQWDAFAVDRAAGSSSGTRSSNPYKKDPPPGGAP